jgi:hypothetical protein
LFLGFFFNAVECALLCTLTEDSDLLLLVLAILSMPVAPQYSSGKSSNEIDDGQPSSDAQPLTMAPSTWWVSNDGQSTTQ